MVVGLLVLVAVTLAVLMLTPYGVGHLFPVVGVEWLVLHHAPLAVDAVELGYLPLLPTLLYVAVLARQTRAVLEDVAEPDVRDVAAAVTGAVLASLLLTGLAVVVMGSAQSDFAVRERSVPEALAWTAGISLSGSALGAWLRCRRALRPHLPDWFRGGLHLGTAYLAATWALGTVLVLGCLVGAWGAVAEVFDIGKGVPGTAALALISIGYLPNVILGAATVAVGGEAHLGEASFSLFAVSRGPMPEVPLAAALPTTDPHWSLQGMLVLTVLATVLLARKVAHWFPSTGEGVRAALTAAAVAALGTAVTSVLVGGTLGTIGVAGTGALIASGVAALVFGIIGSVTVALSLAGLTRRRERERLEIERRRRRLARAEGRDPDARQSDGAVDTDGITDGVTHVDTAVDTDDDHPDAGPAEDPAGDRPRGEPVATGAHTGVGSTAVEPGGTGDDESTPEPGAGGAGPEPQGDDVDGARHLSVVPQPPLPSDDDADGPVPVVAPDGSTDAVPGRSSDDPAGSSPDIPGEGDERSD